MDVGFLGLGGGGGRLSIVVLLLLLGGRLGLGGGLLLLGLLLLLAVAELDLGLLDGVLQQFGRRAGVVRLGVGVGRLGGVLLGLLGLEGAEHGLLVVDVLGLAVVDVHGGGVGLGGGGRSVIGRDGSS